MSPREHIRCTARPTRLGRGKWVRGLRFALTLVWTLFIVGADPFEHQARADGGDAVAAHPADSRDERIRELETAIARDEEVLRVLISSGSSEGDDPLITSPEIREIAHRLPALQDELRVLQTAREKGDAGSAATRVDQ